MSKKETISTMKNWVKMIKTFQSNIEKANPKDRLSFLATICEFHRYSAISINGWLKWLKSPEVMNTFSKEELSLLLEGFRSITRTILDFDLNWSEKELKVWEEQEKETRKVDLPYVG